MRGIGERRADRPAAEAVQIARRIEAAQLEGIEEGVGAKAIEA